MPKYLATPGAEIIGSMMRALLTRLNQEKLMPLMNNVLGSYDMQAIQDEGWYPFQALLDVFKRIAAEYRDTQLIDIGVSYSETSTMPADARTMLAGLLSLSAAYRVGLRNIGIDEGFEITEVGERHIRVKDHTPLPHDLNYGLLWGIARRFHTSTPPCLIWRRYANTAVPDMDGAYYDLTW